MLKISFITLLSLAISGCAVAKFHQMPMSDIKEFTDNADNCEYLSGEWDSSLPRERQIEIEKSADVYCGNAQKQKEKLKVKYKGNAEVERKLSSYDFN